MLKAITKLALAILVILGSVGEAQEAHAIPTQVETHPLSTESLHLLEKQRFEDSLQEKDFSGIIVPNKHQNWTAITSDVLTAASYSPAVYHWIEEFSDENTIKLEDGSEWGFDPKDSHVVDGWKSGATLVISPKSNWFSGSNYDYILTNRDMGESVGANLIDGPIAFGINSYWVAVADWNNGHLHLMNAKGDRSVWEVSPSDVYKIKEWATNQSLIIGENSSWLWLLSDHNHIIINVEMNHYIHARPIDYIPLLKPITAVRSSS